MCGIAGWSFPKGAAPPIRALTRIAHSLAHRGPDGAGLYERESEGIALAHHRLSIIDLSDANGQPMLALEGKVALSYNGELYNFRELRAELQARGVNFATTGDTEVVLKAYLEWGIECLNRFAGMFAIALWDERSKTLHLARDAMGIKPLYWMAHDGGIAFASEARSLGLLPGARLELRERGVAQYLEFGYVIDEDQTIFESIRKLAPGTRLAIREGKLVEKVSFFEPSVKPRVIEDLDGEARAFSALLSQVVDEHLIADVPVSILLSGGLDSSVIAALAAKRANVQALTMAFEGAALDERPFAAQVARHIGASFQEISIAPADVIVELKRNAAMFDDLFADWGTITSRLLYRKCREFGYKVVLVGEGADELLGGYGVFQVPQTLSAWAKFRLYQRYAGQRYGQCRGLFSGVFGAYLSQTSDAFDAVRLFETRRQLPNQYVMKVDKASMAESVEARAPYLDRRVAEFAYGLPRSALLAGDQNKLILRKVAALDGLLPEVIAKRVKYGAPLDATWMDSDTSVRALARARLFADGSMTERFGLRRAMSEYLIERKSGQRWPGAISIYRGLAWRLLLMELWAETVLRAPEKIDDRDSIDLSRPASQTSADIDRGRAENVEETDRSGQPAPEVRSDHSLNVVPGLVTTIIPVFNRAGLLQNAVESVLAQTYRPIEIIVVDDGSTDDTWAAIQSMIAANPGVVRAFKQANQGPGRARQLGIEHAHGEFVQFLDSDDRYLPEKTALQVLALRADTKAGIAYGKAYSVTATGERIPDTAHRTHEQHETLFPSLLAGRIWPTNVPLYRRSALERIGEWPATRQMEDVRFDAQAGAAEIKLAYVDDFVAEVWMHAGEHLGVVWRSDRVAHGQRVHALLEVLERARAAGVPASATELQHYCRTLFLEARWAARAGLGSEADSLLTAASAYARRQRWQYTAFRTAGRTVGWRFAGQLAEITDRFRPR
jgi:asparagine synthase (glutamine-hydrolysing)